jgi:hypothetical protein
MSKSIKIVSSPLATITAQEEILAIKNNITSLIQSMPKTSTSISSFIQNIPDYYKSTYVQQHTVCYAGMDNTYSSLLTTGLGPCIGMGIYNPATHKVSLSHLDDVSTIDSVLNVFKKMRTDANEKLKLVLVGGNNHYNTEYLKQMISDILKIENVEVIHSDLFPENKGALEWQNLMIDSEGNFRTDVSKITFDKTTQDKSLADKLYHANYCEYEFQIQEVELAGGSDLI